MDLRTRAEQKMHACATQVKLWDLGGNKPSLVAAQDAKVGAAFAAAFCPDAPWLLAAGGAAGTVAVWDVLTNAAVATRYGKQLAQSRTAGRQ
jgi:periodic tryptophan protein 1